MQESKHYSLFTMTRGAALFEEQTQADVDRLTIDLDLEDKIGPRDALSKVSRIIEYAKKNPKR